jgi:hypothetical protein
LKLQQSKKTINNEKESNFLTISLAILRILNSYGQDSLKATHRNFSTELNVNLFQGQLTLNNAINQIKFRYMTSNSLALRIGFTVDSKRIINNSESVYGVNPTKDNEKMTTTLIGVNFGLEKHFAGTKRLSPYIGGELAIGYKWSKDVLENNTGTITIDGAWQQYQTFQNSNGYYYTITNNGERGYVSYGLNIVTGFDFYMANHLFIGYELQFGFTNKKCSNIDITSTDSSNPITPPDLDDREFSFGPNIINGIRIGFVF